MSLMFFILGAILRMHPFIAHFGAVMDSAPPATASKVMAGVLYVFVCFYSMGWGMCVCGQLETGLTCSPGPLPWIYVSEIFPLRNRHYGLAFASASQWFWSEFNPKSIAPTHSPFRFRGFTYDY